MDHQIFYYINDRQGALEGCSFIYKVSVMEYCKYTKPQLYIGLRKSRKLCLNLYLQRWVSLMGHAR